MSKHSEYVKKKNLHSIIEEKMEMFLARQNIFVHSKGTL